MTPKNYGLPTKESGGLFTPDFLIEVAKRKVPGHSIINKFGYNPSIDVDGTPADVWSGGGLYNFFPSTAKNMEAVSTSEEDAGTLVSSGEATGGSLTTLEDETADFVSDGVAEDDVLINDVTGQYAIISSVSAKSVTHGAMSNASQMVPISTPNAATHTYRIASNNGDGAGVVHFLGLSSDWELQTETVIMNGLTEVELQHTYIRQHRAFIVISADFNDANLGVISAADQSDGTAVSVAIGVGCGQTEQTIFSIPSGKTGFFLQGYVGMAGVGTPAAVPLTEFVWRTRTFKGPFRTNGRITCSTEGAPWWQYSYKGAPPLPEKSDVKIVCVGVTEDDTSVVGGIDMLLIDNEYL